MSRRVECAKHGQSEETFVCAHLLGDAVGLGFNRDEPTPEEQFPDAWCDDCELIRSAHGGWDDESEKLVKISLLCAGCYERSRIRNTKTSVTLDDLRTLLWKCHSCEQWHTGPCLDFSHDAPYYWRKEYEDNGEIGRPRSFMNHDFCSIEDHDFFIRGVIHLPIIGTAETLRWGVWGSLSRGNFERLIEVNDDPKRVELPPMFSWLSTKIPEYPDTLNLKMYAHIQEVNCCPVFELDPSLHPLAEEFRKGINPERVKQIMLRRVRGSQGNRTP